MHTPEYTAKIRDLIVAKDAEEALAYLALYRFRNGWRVDAETISSMRDNFEAMVAILEEGKGSK